MDHLLERNVELLKFMYQNAEMGVNTLSQLNEIAEDTQLRKVIQKQLLEYKSVFDQCKRKLDQNDEEAKSINGMLKTSAHVMINMKTMMDKSPEHIAEMIIQGGIMGIINITKKLKEYVDCNDDIKNIGYKLMWIEQKNTEEMKHFL